MLIHQIYPPYGSGTSTFWVVYLTDVCVCVFVIQFSNTKMFAKAHTRRRNKALHDSFTRLCDVHRRYLLWNVYYDMCMYGRSRRKGFTVEADYLFNASSSPLARRRRYDSCTIIFFISLCCLLAVKFVHIQIHDTLVIQIYIVAMDTFALCIFSKKLKKLHAIVVWFFCKFSCNSCYEWKHTFRCMTNKHFIITL